MPTQQLGRGARLLDEVVEPAGAAALETGLRIRAMPCTSGSGIDLAIEAMAG